MTKLEIFKRDTDEDKLTLAHILRDFIITQVETGAGQNPNLEENT